MRTRFGLCFFLLLLCCAATSLAANEPPTGTQSEEGLGEPDLDNEETFIDVSDALRSKQYVHRAILSAIVQDTNRFAVPRFYVGHMMGFNQVWQREDNYTKFSSGLQGLSLGYVSAWGHAVEVAAELSAVNNVLVGYKYFLRPAKFPLWFTVGVGVGTEFEGVDFAQGTPESTAYTGPSQMTYASAAVLVPTVDVGFRGEVRLSFYGPARYIFTSGVGIILFL